MKKMSTRPFVRHNGGRAFPEQLAYEGRTYSLQSEGSPVPGDARNVVDHPSYAARRKRLGSRLLDGREGLAEAAITVPVVGSLFQIAFPVPFGDLTESGRRLAQAYTTISDAVQGGPPGQRASRSLDEAIRAVTAAGSNNAEAARSLEQLYASRKSFVENLLKVYNENETTVRVAQRTAVQLKGSAKEFFQIGEDLKADWWRQTVDRPIILVFGKINPEYRGLSDDQIVIKVLENSENMRTFYTEARKFYDSRQKGEEAVNAFASFLEKTIADTEAYNGKIESVFPDIIRMTKQGYSVEDIIINTDAKGAAISREDVAKTGKAVNEYGQVVGDTRSEVGQYTPLPGAGLDLVGLVTNPFFVTAAAYVAFRGARAILLPGPLDRGISRLVVSPVKQALNATHYLLGKGASLRANRRD
ncbi:hypothetical protein HYU15_02010, partial [Candidatus Woesearchaeota archaeon]|nr:hypothetical protein [Candidatus Woesearchaeota archaeon]